MDRRSSYRPGDDPVRGHAALYGDAPRRSGLNRVRRFQGVRDGQGMNCPRGERGMPPDVSVPAESGYSDVRPGRQRPFGRAAMVVYTARHGQSLAGSRECRVSDGLTGRAFTEVGAFPCTPFPRWPGLLTVSGYIARPGLRFQRQCGNPLELDGDPLAPAYAVGNAARQVGCSHPD